VLDLDDDYGGGASRTPERTHRCLVHRSSIVVRERRNNKIIKAKGSCPDNITASTRVVCVYYIVQRYLTRVYITIIMLYRLYRYIIHYCMRVLRRAFLIVCKKTSCVFVWSANGSHRLRRRVSNTIYPPRYVSRVPAYLYYGLSISLFKRIEKSPQDVFVHRWYYACTG